MQYLKFLIVFVLILTGVKIKAQDISKYENSDDSLGLVNIFQDERVKELLKTDSIINSKQQSFSGYRIQIFLGGSTDKEKAFEIKKEFKELFPQERAYVVYTAPDFRVRVGNFRSKLECIELYKACLDFFPNCYPVKTEIMFSDLVPVKEEAEELIVDENIE
ncbi:hypothetical protein ACT3CE_14175 [Marinifilum sp. RC60d5]|uniref:hypothetical protein n=1 Tax=Marinifilum sp. RC60d5 TaxID=3458414 RepID=UPI0040351566